MPKWPRARRSLAPSLAPGGQVGVEGVTKGSGHPPTLAHRLFRPPRLQHAPSAPFVPPSLPLLSGCLLRMRNGQVQAAPQTRHASAGSSLPEDPEAQPRFPTLEGGEQGPRGRERTRPPPPRAWHPPAGPEPGSRKVTQRRARCCAGEIRRMRVLVGWGGVLSPRSTPADGARAPLGRLHLGAPQHHPWGIGRSERR